LNYLRKIDALVIEELVLTALAGKGHVAKRSARYSGDGGIDGRVFCLSDRQWVGVQCKRYAGPIQVSDVERFARDLTREGLLRGYFVHTGTTPIGGRLNRQALLSAAPSIEIISGQALISLISLAGRRDMAIGGSRADKAV